MKRILITGPQGSGKTTQAEIIAQKLGVAFIGAGDLLRDFAKRSNSEAKDVSKDLLQGQLVDDQVIGKLMSEQINSAEAKKGFVVDGYPRSLSQLNTYDPEYNKVIYLKISDEEAEKRLLARGREDDTLEKIRTRLSWYHEETEPILNSYRNLNILSIVNGEQPIEKVTEEIESCLKNFNNE